MILYKELIEKTGVYTKGFDLTSLPDGKYFFELDKDLEINTIPFTVTSNSVVFNKEKKKVIYKPFIRIKEDVVYISKLALNKAPLKVDIYYLNSGHTERMYSEVVKNTRNIQKAFKLTGLEKGRYKVVMRIKS